MSESGYLYQELSYKIIGCAQAVHRQLGPGFPESVYHRALCIELPEAGLAAETEQSVDVAYKGQNVGVFRPDLLIDGKIHS